MAKKSVLGETSIEQFLREHWQKEPVLLRGALEGFTSPISSEELAGLACEEDAEARLVQGSKSWTLRHGPFSEADFESLGPDNWTLLVQDVDKHVPAVAQLLELVDFLPRWMVDDIMISHATPGGSVGPHVDLYDVFLLQAQGTRRWQLSTRCEPERLRQDTDLKVLEEFEAEMTLEANPGDVLYIPPGVAHWGVATTDCMTYSFGFRAPTQADLVDALSAELMDRAEPARLTETLHTPVRKRSELTPELRERAQQLVMDLVAGSADAWLGRFLTRPKENLAVAPPDAARSGAELIRRLRDGARLVRDPASRFLYATGEGTTLFVDGQDYDLSAQDNAATLAGVLCDAALISAADLGGWLETAQLAALLDRLYASGCLRFEDEL